MSLGQDGRPRRRRRAHRVPVVVAPGELCASCQAWPCGHHIERSARKPTPLVDVDDASRPRCRRAAGPRARTLMVRAAVGRHDVSRAARSRPTAAGRSRGRRPAVAFGLASSTNSVEERCRSRPRRRTTASDGAGHAGAVVAGGERGPAADEYIARSTMIGTRVEAGDGGRDVGRRSSPGSLVDLDGEPAVRRHGVGPHDRRARRQQVADLRRCAVVSGSGSAAGRTGRRRRASRPRRGTTSARAPASSSRRASRSARPIPAHRPIDHDLHVRLDDGRDVGRRQPGEQPQRRSCAATAPARPGTAADRPRRSPSGSGTARAPASTPGLATTTRVSKNEPVAPSAR